VSHLCKLANLMRNFNIVIAGVGGQGLITLTQILAEAALIEGYDVKTSELHGLSQRGGSVETHIRFGKRIFSPLVGRGTADLILGLEMTEGLRALSYANSETIFLINKNFISYGEELSEKDVLEKINSLIKKNLYLIPASEICQKELEKEVVSGVYLLSYAVHKKIIPLKPESLIFAVKKVIPEKYLELNQKAFNLAKKNDN